MKVLLRVSHSHPTVLPEKPIQIDVRKKTVTLFDPGSDSMAPETPEKHSRVGIVAPKAFSFDAIFEGEDSQVRFIVTSEKY